MKKFAVFDLDGTLIRWQLYHAVVDKLAKAGHLGPDAREKLHEARMRWKRREPGYSFRDYESVLVHLHDDLVSQIPPEKYDALVGEVTAEYKDQVYTYTRDLIRQLQSEGYVLLAISGSHQELVAEVARHYGFADWIGTRYPRSSEGFTGQKFGGSDDKGMKLNELVRKHNLSFQDSYAVGDSQSDASMLKLVDHPIAFNPDKALYDIAREHGWDIVIERKNVVYQLTNVNNEYRLR